MSQQEILKTMKQNPHKIYTTKDFAYIRNHNICKNVRKLAQFGYIELIRAEHACLFKWKLKGG